MNQSESKKISFGKIKNLLPFILSPPQATGYYGRTSTPCGLAGDSKTKAKAKNKVDPRVEVLNPTE